MEEWNIVTKKGLTGTLKLTGSSAFTFVKTAAPKAALGVGNAALKIGTQSLLKVLKNVPDNTLVKNSIRNPNVPLSKAKRGGIRFTSKHGEGEDGAVHSDDADGQPESIDDMMDMFEMGIKELKPDLKDPMAYPELANKLFGLYKNTIERARNSAPKKFKDSDQNSSKPASDRFIEVKNSPTVYDRAYMKKGNNVYDRGIGQTLHVNGDGTFTPTKKPAKDTFPKEKLAPDYLHPYN
ncbi:MAG: hypothetical protein M3004_02830 [Bacteroidota bacterium]|nr:hypothetical protein [Bacteroidota bacterium]